MQCTKCGSEIGSGDRFCPVCKTPAPGQYVNPQFHGVVPPKDENGEELPREDRPAADGLIILSLLMPFVGFLIGAICLGNKEKRAGRAYILLSFINLLLCIIIIVFVFVLPFIVLGRAVT
ncbi:zinc ribbon domain-containing protein [Ruminococcus sp.]|uniref:zinc ribbon domain-containing protein n=1 Tax=Ruminococcus sp. TaxID=41978 RepID=UPI001B691C36|nr:zinc ribbon domain-containing protein [Ruminococcus sp.]MBP5433096.1 zinc ribbon domain-containing protein [Ruminococcus sp.]